MRALLIAVAIALLPGCAHAQDGRIDRSDTPDVRATANVVVQALAPNDLGDWRYRWDAVSIRVSRFVHWHIYAPDQRNRASDAIARRNGWLDLENANVDVSVFGTDDAVTVLSFEYPFTNLDLLDALRDAGAEVSFQADYETYSQYVVTPPGRATGLLTTTRTCTPDGMRPAQRCQNGAELKFALE